MKKILILSLALLSINACAKSFEDLLAPPEQIISTHTLVDFTALWWQWAYSMPSEINPVKDRTGEHCHQGQDGDVWFLAGGFGSSKIRRTCEIPAGKYIFFPIINMVYWRPEDGSLSCDDAKKYAALNNDQLLFIDIELDSVKASNPAHTRLSSDKCFNIYAAAVKNYNVYDAYPAATDGYWIMLKPLAKGRHKLKFQAGYNRENGSFGNMAQDIEYELIIK